MDLQDLRGASREWVGRLRYAFELAAPRRYLFIMSHMRSYSSLLCHILNSNPGVAGYVEMHESYSTGLDLIKLTMRVRDLTGQRLRRGQYVLDKLLFNYDISEQVLARDDLVMLFTIREPEKAIRSIIAMGRRRRKPDWKSKPARVVDYYTRRLERLGEIAEARPHGTLFFEADQLVDDTSTVLRAFDTFLALRTPLRPEYQTFEHSGTPKFGDPSKFITEGRIVRDRRSYDALDVPDDLMAQAWEGFTRARKVLAASCEVDVSQPYEPVARPS